MENQASDISQTILTKDACLYVQNDDGTYRKLANGPIATVEIEEPSNAKATFDDPEVIDSHFTKYRRFKVEGEWFNPDSWIIDAEYKEHEK